jgi:hypothetical protein
MAANMVKDLYHFIINNLSNIKRGNIELNSFKLFEKKKFFAALEEVKFIRISGSSL